MKKLLATLLALILILGCGATVFATTPQENDGESTTEEAESPFKSLAEIDTKLIGAPTVIENIATAENLINLNDTPVMQGAWLDIGKAKNLDAVPLKDDKVALSYFMTCMESTIPILKIDNKKTAESVYYYLLEEQATDYIIASENDKVLEFFGSKETENVVLAYIANSKDSPEKIAQTANRLGANICVLQTADRETAKYLQNRFLSLILFNQDLNTRDSVDAAADCGSNGVVVNSAEETYKLYEKVNKATYLRKPLIISNSVMLSTKEATNTLEDLKKAYKAGADSTKVNIKLDSEKELVCWWDSKTDEKATTFKEICTLLSKQDPFKTLILKIEQGDTDLIKEIKSVAKKQNVLDRILIDTTDEAIITTCKDMIPEVGFFKTYTQEEISYLPDLLHRGIIKALLVEEPNGEETEGEDVESETLKAIKKVAKSGAVLITTDYADLGETFRKSLKLKNPLDIFGPIEVTKISISKIKIELRTGKTKTLKATVEPENATYKKVTWKSSNPKVATVDENGLVTAKRGGEAVITVAAEGGKFVTCVVTVKGYLLLIIIIILSLGLIGAGFYLFKFKKIKIDLKKIKLPNLKQRSKH